MSEDRTEYAEGVCLSASEYKKLCDQWGEADAKGMIQFLSDYKLERGYKAKVDFLCIRRWVFSAYFDWKAKLAEHHSSRPRVPYVRQPQRVSNEKVESIGSIVKQLKVVSHG